MISIIIIVKSDRRIMRLLASLEGIDKPDTTEIIVVDASKGQLNDIKSEFKIDKWIPFYKVTRKSTTIPDQRNVGLKHANGEIIVFIDSDCIPEKKWLKELVKPIINESEYIVSGRVSLKDKNSLHSLETDKNLHKKYIDECPTMNVAISKEVFRKVGKFDESFEFGSDVDFVWRARKNGYKIRYNKNAVISHDLGNTKNDLRRMYVYGKARMHLYKKHKYRWRFFIGNEMLYTLYPLFFLFLPITFIFPFYPLLGLIPIIKYYTNNPFKIIIMRTMYGIGIIKEILSF